MDNIGRLWSKYSNLSKPTKSALWFTVCYALQRGLQFISMPIYTRIMSLEEYGVYSVFLSWCTLICVISSMNVYAGTFNKAMMRYEYHRDEYISSVQWLTFFISMGVSAVILCFHERIYDYLGYSWELQFLLCMHILFFPSLQYWAQKQRFLFEYRKFLIITLANSVISLFLGIVLVNLSDEKSVTLIVVTVGIQTVINGTIFIYQVIKGKCFYKKDYWKWSMLMAIPLMPHYISEILLGHADRLMIDQMCGAAEAGIYSIVYQISMVMTILRTGMNAAFIPWQYYSIKNKNYNKIKSVTRNLTLLIWILTILLILIGPEIIKIVAPAEYYEAIIDIPAIMIGCYFIFIYVLFLNIEIYYEKNQYVAIVSVVVSLLNIVLNYYFIQWFGYLSAGYTTMISYILMAAIHLFIVNRILKPYGPLSMLYDIKLIIKLSSLLIVIGFVALILYQFICLRYGTILFSMGFIYTKRKNFMHMLEELHNR